MNQVEEIVEPRHRRRRRILMPLRRPRWSVVISGFVLLLLLLIVVIWFSRIRIATDFIEDELERRGVRATYKVAQIGFRTQRLEDVVLGDPRNPDLTARWVEVDVSLGFRSTRVSLITARGVRIRGRIVDGKVRLGELDKLLPPPTGRPFRLPNQRVDLADAAVRLDTPVGRVGIAIEGKGNLAYSFEGRIAAEATRLTPGDCVLDSTKFFANVTTDEERPSFRGPLRADRITCGTVELTRPNFALRTTLSPGFDSWTGDSAVRLARFRSGANSFGGLAGQVSFNGDKRLTRGAMDLAAAGTAVGGFRTGRARIDGRYAFSPSSGNLSLLGDTSAQGVTGATEAVQPVVRALGSANGTPLDPIGDALAAAVGRAAQNFDFTGAVRLVNEGRRGAVRFDQIAIRSRSGARLAARGGQGVTYYWPLGLTKVGGEFALSGGGLPTTRLSLNQPRGGGPISGTARIAPMQAGAARLALSEIRFAAGQAGGTTVSTVATIDGPFNDGRVAGLVVPISGRFGNGGFAFGERCTPVTFRFLQAAGLRLGPSRLPLCPTGRALLWRDGGGLVQGGAEVRALRLTGQLGRSPIQMVSDRVRLNLSEPGFSGNNVAVRLGASGAVNRLDLATLTGRFNRLGVIGTFAGGSGKLNNVPLLLSAGAGRWSVQRGDLTVDGGLTVADEKDPPRFYPLVTNDFHLTLIDNRIAARGWLQDPQTGTRVAEATIAHSLRADSGNAVLDVPGIRFDERYQPEELTRLTTGVVALVNGVLRGRGNIAWSREGGTTSTGTFSTEDMNLAASFGPVTGLSTTIEFSDLLRLQTAPGQIAEVDRIQAGIDVFDGRIRYQLLPDLRVRVESGRWPFAGGELFLEETILDFSQPSRKLLTFRVVGMDAAALIEQLQFTKIAATGIFDGTLPMIFEQSGGRIVGGRLVARPGGGTLSYIGEVGEEQLGTYGKLAFDALKSLRYSRFEIDLNGSLEGEFLAGIQLDGLARTGPGPGGIIGSVLKEVSKIPLEFNIEIRGPFRALIATSRSFEDPSLLIQPVLPEELQNFPTTVTTIESKESETKP